MPIIPKDEGEVLPPTTVPTQAEGNVSPPTNVGTKAEGAVGVPTTVPTEAEGVVPRTLTAVVDMNFSQDLYAISGASADFEDFLTYARDSSATFVDRRIVGNVTCYFLNTDFVGDVENLILWSEQFEQSEWGKFEVTITADNTDAPDGSLTADLYTVTGAINPRLQQTVTSTETEVCWSIWVKAAKGNTGKVGELAVFRDGTLELATRSFVLTGEWQRVELHHTFAVAPATVTVRIDHGTAGSPPVVGDEFFIWGAQLVADVKPRPYVKTTGAAVTETFTESIRIEYDATTGEKLGMLFEPDTTNLLTRSEELDDGDWGGTTNVSVTTDEVDAPDGTRSADTVTDDATDGSHFVGQLAALTAATTYTVSAFVKQKDGIFFYFLANEDGAKSNNVNIFFDPADGSVGTMADNGDFTFVSSSVTELSSGWWRFALTFTTGALATGPNSGLRLGVAIDVGDVSYIGTGESLYIWGAQLEEQPAATSYIRTGSATAARLADDLSAPAGLFVDMTDFTLLAGVDAVAANDGRLFFLSALQGDAFATFDSSPQAMQQRYGTTAHNSSSTYTVDTHFEYAMVFDKAANTLANYSDGVKHDELDAGTPFIADPEGTFAIGSRDDFAFPMHGHITHMRIIDAAFTDSEVALA